MDQLCIGSEIDRFEQSLNSMQLKNLAWKLGLQNGACIETTPRFFVILRIFSLINAITMRTKIRNFEKWIMRREILKTIEDK